MSLELRPELQVFVEDLQSLFVVFGELDLLPELLGQVGSLDGLHVEVTVAFVFKHGGVATVGQRTRVARTQTREVVLVAAKGLLHCPTSGTSCA